MSLKNKKVWIDIEEPKTGIMFNSLIRKFTEEGAQILITARDYDSTWDIMDDLGYEYHRIGKHGGERLEDKLKTYIDRLSELLPLIIDFHPDFFVTFSSVEGARIAFGLQIPSIGFNDEPRNGPVCKLLLPYMDKIITPGCIPKELYFNLHLSPDRILPYNGIDEIAWLSSYVPNQSVLSKFDVEPGKYVLMRSEPTFASYFIDKLVPEETYLAKYFPALISEFPEHKFLLLVRTNKQEIWLNDALKDYLDNPNVRITRYLPNIVDLCFFASLVISGGGTIVRESSLLGVPSLEYFPGDTAPQETFLIENGFPMEHIRETESLIKRALEILHEGPIKGRFDLSFKAKLKQFENPNEICFDYVKNNI